jgi:hypothetical protein
MKDIAKRTDISNTNNAWWLNKPAYQDKKIIAKIRDHIKEFNKEYDNTEVDTFAFEKVLTTSEIVDLIYVYVFQSFLFEYKALDEFKDMITSVAIDRVNAFYKKFDRKVANENIFRSYFSHLIDSVLLYRDSLLSLQLCAQTSIINDKIEHAKREILDAIHNTKC